MQALNNSYSNTYSTPAYITWLLNQCDSVLRVQGDEFKRVYAEVFPTATISTPSSARHPSRQDAQQPFPISYGMHARDSNTSPTSPFTTFDWSLDPFLSSNAAVLGPVQSQAMHTTNPEVYHTYNNPFQSSALTQHYKGQAVVDNNNSKAAEQFMAGSSTESITPYNYQPTMSPNHYPTDNQRRSYSYHAVEYHQDQVQPSPSWSASTHSVGGMPPSPDVALKYGQTLPNLQQQIEAPTPVADQTPTTRSRRCQPATQSKSSVPSPREAELNNQKKSTKAPEADKVRSSEGYLIERRIQELVDNGGRSSEEPRKAKAKAPSRAQPGKQRALPEGTQSESAQNGEATFVIYDPFAVQEPKPEPTVQKPKLGKRKSEAREGEAVAAQPYASTSTSAARPGKRARLDGASPLPLSPASQAPSVSSSSSSSSSSAPSSPLSPVPQTGQKGSRAPMKRPGHYKTDGKFKLYADARAQEKNRECSLEFIPHIEGPA